MTPARLAIFALLMLAALGLAARGLAPDPVVPASAPATAFSGERAMAHVRAIAAAPRPHGSAAAKRARDYLAGRLGAAGFQVRVTREVGVSVDPDRRTIAGGVVENIVARLPGRDPRLPAILIMAHYDSVENAPGAGDDAAGSAAAVEIGRAITAGPRPLRDTVILLTDGEESGLLGARAYFAQPARASGVGAAINLEARGTRGRPILFEAGARSNGLVKLYLGESGHVFAHSPAATIYGLLPNSTDLTAAIRAGVPGLNFAFTSGEVDYHAPTDSIVNLDPRSVQGLGDAVLPVARQLADMGALPPDRGALVYGQVPGLFALSYPAWVGWLGLLAGAAALAAAALIGRAKRSAVVRGAAAGLYVLLASAAAFQAVRGLTGVPDVYGSNKPLLAGFGAYELALVLAGLGTIVLALSITARGRTRIWGAVLGIALAVLVLVGGGSWMFAALGVAAAAVAMFAFARSGDGPSVMIGFTAFGLALALAAQIALPAASSIIAWSAVPAAFAVLAIIVLKEGPAGWALAAAIALAPLSYTLLVGHLTVVSLGALVPAALAALALSAALLLCPLLADAGRRAAVAGAVTLSVGLLLAAAFGMLNRPTERTPQLTQVVHVADPGQGRALTYAGLTPLDPWSASVLRADGGEPRLGPVPEIADLPVWQAPARAVPTPPAPPMRLARQGARRVLVIGANGARDLRVRLESATPLSAVTLNGVPLPGALAGPGVWRLRWRGDGAPAVIAFAPAGEGSLGVDAVAFHDGWPQAARPLPPRGTKVAPWLSTDKTAVIARARFGL